MPVNRHVVFSSSCGAGMRYGKRPSEFGVPRGGTAWRARGHPLAVTEPRTQYLVILSQPARVQLYGGPLLPLRLACWPLHCRVPFLHRVTYYCVSYLLSSQEPVPHTIVVTVIQLAHTMTSSMRVQGYPCVPLYSRMGA